MKIKSLKLTNFRNYHSLEIEFNPGINIFIGENGVGKTNILESIYVLALTKTNRDSYDNDMIKFQESLFRIEGKIESGGMLKKKEVYLKDNKKQQYKKRKKKKKHREKKKEK